MTFSFDFDLYTASLLVAAFVCAILSAVVGLRQMRKVARFGRRMTDEIPSDDNLPGISVIVYAHNAEENIKEFLEELLQQDHPKFEVIVVNDASVDNTREIVETLAEKEPRLYMTFVSDTAKNISHRKLAYTVGMRAAKYPVALLTASNIHIPSRSWLRLMAAPFANPATEVAIGVAYVPKEVDKGLGKFWRSFDLLTRQTRWIGASLLNSTYRGTAYNLAFRPDTFFNHNGFTATNRFQAGEDDIFINEISTPENTVAIFQPDAMVAIDVPSEEYPRLWKRHKERYTFTSRYLHTSALRIQGLHSILIWLTVICAVLAGLSGLPNLAPVCIALLILLLFWADQICVYRRAASALKSIRLWWAVPLFWLARPIVNAAYRVGFQAKIDTNYTWRHPK